MSNQSEDGWFPECIICDCGNLGSSVVCEDCYNKTKKKMLDEVKKMIDEFETGTDLLMELAKWKEGKTTYKECQRIIQNKLKLKLK